MRSSLSFLAVLAAAWPLNLVGVVGAERLVVSDQRNKTLEVAFEGGEASRRNVPGLCGHLGKGVLVGDENTMAQLFAPKLKTNMGGTFKWSRPTHMSEWGEYPMMAKIAIWPRKYSPMDTFNNIFGPYKLNARFDPETVTFAGKVMTIPVATQMEGTEKIPTGTNVKVTVTADTDARLADLKTCIGAFVTHKHKNAPK
uniref:Uncharacterized protein n=1 Tax=Lotharella oceanica TaxID=641309 RepID=A0A7S2TK70_9EUKA|mmetsp:Transcript_17538/g.33278  ORF Transcript_17538/g.33278 Transcript_17538/m.33278 type:complete len:198 (+) Transcript_17538:1-594(+)